MPAYSVTCWPTRVPAPISIHGSPKIAPGGKARIVREHTGTGWRSPGESGEASEANEANGTGEVREAGDTGEEAEIVG